jgi:hypothetical protein
LKKIALLVAMILCLLVALAPAVLADDKKDHRDKKDNDRITQRDLRELRHDILHDLNNDNDNDFCDVFDCNDLNDLNDEDNNDVPLLTQDSDQDVTSGSSIQNIDVVGGGDNSNQCVSIQPVSNTGNVANQVSAAQLGAQQGDDGVVRDRNGDPVILDENGDGAGEQVMGIDASGNLVIDPSQSVSCDQQVNQAATAV